MTDETGDISFPNDGAGGWVLCADRLPPVDMEVIVYFPDEMEMAFCYRPADRADMWYPGGSSVELDHQWRDCPLPPQLGPNEDNRL